MMNRLRWLWGWGTGKGLRAVEDENIKYVSLYHHYYKGLWR